MSSDMPFDLLFILIVLWLLALLFFLLTLRLISLSLPPLPYVVFEAAWLQFAQAGKCWALPAGRCAHNIFLASGNRQDRRVQPVAWRARARAAHWPDLDVLNFVFVCAPWSRLWAEVFHVSASGAGTVKWQQVSEDLVPVNITCIQDSPECVFHITAYNSQVDKILDVRLIQPGS